MVVDLVFWEEVMVYQQFIGGMEVVQDEDFCSKLEDWEVGMVQQVDFGNILKVVSCWLLWQYVVVVVGVLFIVFFIFSFYLKVNYSGLVLSCVYYELFIFECMMGGENIESIFLQERMDFVYC